MEPNQSQNALIDGNSPDEETSPTINITDNYVSDPWHHKSGHIDRSASPVNGYTVDNDIDGVWVLQDPNSNRTVRSRGSKDHKYSPLLSIPADGSNMKTKEEEAKAEAAKSGRPQSPIIPRVYYRRWFMLLIFCLVSMSNAAQWIQYATISNVVRDYYNVGYLTVDWLSMIYMLVYIPLIFPVTWLLEREQGLKVIGVLAASLNCSGAWLRYAGSVPETFWLAFLGQTVVSIAQVFILGMPAHVAATWFGANEVSTACAIGVFGNQLGVALGFVLPPILVSNNENVQREMELMFLGTALITSFLLILIFVVYQDKPPVPPSHAKLGAQISVCQRSYGQSITSLFMNVGFVLLVITYGVNVGSFYAISTLLNQIVLSEFPREEMMVGIIGLTIVISGMFGSVVTGLWLDRSRTYRGTTVVVYFLSLIGMVIFTFTLRLHNIWFVFGVSAFLGFFMTGYLPLGFEFAAELTFPEPEGTSSGLLNASAQTFGIIFTMVMGSLLQQVSVKVANLFLCGSLLIGLVLTAMIKSDLRRQRAEKQEFEMIPEVQKLPVETDGSEEIKQMKETTT